TSSTRQELIGRRSNAMLTLVTSSATAICPSRLQSPKQGPRVGVARCVRTLVAVGSGVTVLDGLEVAVGIRVSVYVRVGVRVAVARGKVGRRWQVLPARSHCSSWDVS